MGKKANRSFCQIPYRKLIGKIRDRLEKNNQELEEQEESYTSMCDALSLEKICRHDKYLGKRLKRGLFLSGTGKLLNADLNGAINIMRKYSDKIGKPMTEITGDDIFHPVVINID
jgi:putative transposase